MEVLKLFKEFEGQKGHRRVNLVVDVTQVNYFLEMRSSSKRQKEAREQIKKPKSPTDALHFGSSMVCLEK